MMENKTKKFLASDITIEFRSMFSSDTWKDQFGNIHKIEDLEESSYEDWKFKLFVKDQYRCPKVPLSTEGVYLIEHREHHYDKVYVQGTLEKAIRFLISNPKFSRGWAETDMGWIKKIDIVSL